jgi:hypothetical protein
VALPLLNFQQVNEFDTIYHFKPRQNWSFGIRVASAIAHAKQILCSGAP